MALSEHDLTRLRLVIREEVPALVRSELVGIGLSAEDGKGRVDIQEHMVFLRRLKKTADGMTGAAGKAIAGLTVAAAAGFAAFFHLRGTP
jgi:hypothetical protein